MELNDFSKRQIQEVRSLANTLRLARRVRNLDALASESLALFQLRTRQFNGNQFLKAVSLDELLNEMDFPGSFSNEA